MINIYRANTPAGEFIAVPEDSGNPETACYGCVADGDIKLCRHLPYCHDRHIIWVPDTLENRQKSAALLFEEMLRDNRTEK